MAQPRRDTKRKRIIRKLRNKYRMVIINDTTFDERLSLRLTPLNLITLVGMSFLVVSFITGALIVFTPMREYIPGYSDAQAKRYAFEAARKADSLEYAMALQAQYFTDLKSILNGETLSDTTNAVPAAPRETAADFGITPEDSALRARIEREEAYSLTLEQNSRKARGMAGVFFFTPLRGVVTASFNPSQGHYGTDLAGAANEPIKAVLDGTVISASFTTDAGYVIAVQHNYNLVSVYKHNSVLLKRTGDAIKAGESIAIIGNSGELSDGPHLHFELWQAGRALNPQEFIAFE